MVDQIFTVYHKWYDHSWHNKDIWKTPQCLREIMCFCWSNFSGSLYLSLEIGSQDSFFFILLSKWPQTGYLFYFFFSVFNYCFRWILSLTIAKVGYESNLDNLSVWFSYSFWFTWLTISRFKIQFNTFHGKIDSNDMSFHLGVLNHY